ncbi:AI-2E family transporter [Actinocrinis sp.]|uniref:AI-2E family transporter n=1 Tax=Actinocrinis sp. TaxID=1920516 RepID=UPI002C6F9F55|nr:AI-2E family transporter [Actinocrinis sp.]HXR71893.1 AI-2E family transporter [Actinocrinis sp.]
MSVDEASEVAETTTTDASAAAPAGLAAAQDEDVTTTDSPKADAPSKSGDAKPGTSTSRDSTSGDSKTNASPDSGGKNGRGSGARRPGRPLRRSHPYYVGFVGGLGLILAYYLAQALVSLTGVLVLIVIALFLAVGLNPFVERLTDRGLQRRWAVLIVAGTCLLLFAGFVTAIAQPLAQQTSSLIASLPHHLQQLGQNATVRRFDAKYNVVGRLQNLLAQADTAKMIAGGILGFGEFLISSVFKSFTVLVMTIYFLGSLPTIKQSTYQLIPASRRARVGALADGVLERVGGYVSGAVTVAALAGLASYLMLAVLNVPYMLPLALLIAMTDFVPLVGATIGALIVTLVVLFDSPVKAVVAGIFFIVYQQFENFVIYPRVMARSVDVPPMIAVIAALIGAALLGVVGALLAIPLSAGLAYIVREVLLPRQDRS